MKTTEEQWWTIGYHNFPQQVIDNLGWLKYVEVVVNLNYHEVTEEVHHSNLIPAKDK